MLEFLLGALAFTPVPVPLAARRSVAVRAPAPVAAIDPSQLIGGGLVVALGGVYLIGSQKKEADGAPAAAATKPAAAATKPPSPSPKKSPPAAAKKKWPYRGGLSRGIRKKQWNEFKTPRRELWKPPPGWEPPSKPPAPVKVEGAGVVSWYDSGVRLK